MLQGAGCKESHENLINPCKTLVVPPRSDFYGPMTPDFSLNGFELYEQALDGSQQSSLVAELRELTMKTPMVQPVTPGGKRMSVRMTSLGRVGWVTDRTGYRYEPTHPNGLPWPTIPASVLEIWQRVTGLGRQPDCCLLNYYSENAKMGLHQDNDEGDFDWPVVSASLGDEALFRMGGPRRGGKTRSVWLRSGDVLVMGGEARLAYHGIDRIKFGTSPLLPKKGRLNLTLRVVA